MIFADVDSGAMMLLAMLVILGIYGLIMSLTSIIGQFMLFSRANQPGWAAIIPFYNLYIMGKVMGRNPWLVIGIVFVGGLLSSLTMGLAYLPIMYVWYEFVIVFGMGRMGGIAAIFFPGFVTLWAAFQPQKYPYLGPFGNPELRLLMSSQWLDSSAGGAPMGMSPYAQPAGQPGYAANPYGQAPAVPAPYAAPPVDNAPMPTPDTTPPAPGSFAPQEAPQEGQDPTNPFNA